MEMRFTPEEEAFRIEVREFIAANLPADIRRKVSLGLRLEREDFVRWQDILARRGWYAVNWPQEYGGPGWSAVQKYLFMQEYGAQPCPPLVQFGVNMVGPVIYTYGSPAQKARFLPRILNNQDWWCQGYSEPGSGSDLASLKTTAVRDGDHYVVNGSKIWTTWAQWADWMFALVRTSKEERPQQGISFLLLDMRSPGVSVRPIRMLDGDAEVNEVFFDNVRVPVEQLVGGEGTGWSYGKFLLEHERFVISGVARSRRLLARLKTVAGQRGDGLGGALLDDQVLRLRFADLETQLAALEYTELRFLSAMNAGQSPGNAASMLKIRGTEIEQSISELAMDCMGLDALALDEALLDGEVDDSQALAPEFAAAAGPLYFNLRKVSIWGGSNEIQRNILAKHVLGL
ncbi:pimeloyl-CoA dehydrogenase large subunit [Bordetella trematum]|uniref:Acyl-CoA dehydrogenase n=1 Tax=Bordetella trematum TaxID=123899 RepID=A0A157SJ86_9BORD|nr:acyl-CoA dehydrogenase family protein [Bordetella trematum]AZR93188.1 pimeloyl-CoA dehydrogenase large subunit [Bordetella trematum]NNH21126.1 pimeloyl-CoA dehydrogenase large subunit [Bordetella trematum]QIM71792.1 pimeloyl-CoA dehydrogenase large subunit [Bordetella trematum]SAI23906.1 acyl-CoA dehydrogenase [Bordetella trematum]SAI26208.1 acyl-CoA dehydrogenase [Bordetella trematum]